MPRINAARDHEGVPVHDREAVKDFILNFRYYLVKRSLHWEPEAHAEAITDALATENMPLSARMRLLELVIGCYQEGEDEVDAEIDRDRQRRHRWKRGR